MAKRGRPTKLRCVTADCIISAIQWGASRAQAAREAHIDERTLRYWRRKGRESDSGPERDLLRQMDAVEAARARIKPRPAPVPVKVIEAIVKTRADGEIRLDPVQLTLDALNHLLEATTRVGSGIASSASGEKSWYWVQQPRLDRSLSTTQSELIYGFLRVEVVDQMDAHGWVEFKPLHAGHD